MCRKSAPVGCDVADSAAFASKPAPTGQRISKWGPGLLAKRPVRTAKKSARAGAMLTAPALSRASPLPQKNVFQSGSRAGREGAFANSTKIRSGGCDVDCAGAFASKPAPTGECSSMREPGLPAKRPVRTAQKSARPGAMLTAMPPSRASSLPQDSAFQSGAGLAREGASQNTA